MHHYLLKILNLYEQVFHQVHIKRNNPPFLNPLIHATEERRAKGLPNLFNSHMFDGSALPLKENLDIAADLLKRCHANEIILEVEAGVVGGEEDGVDNANQPAEKLSQEGL